MIRRPLDIDENTPWQELTLGGEVAEGGTARAMLKLANFHFQLPEDNRIITMAQMDELTQLLCQRKKPARKLVLRLCPDRVHTILPGAVLMNELCRRVCREQIYISRYGVREGYLCRKL